MEKLKINKKSRRSDRSCGGDDREKMPAALSGGAGRLVDVGGVVIVRGCG